MRTEEQTYQLFEDYIADRLSPEERLSFENELDQNIALKYEFEAHEYAHQLVAIGSLYELEKQVKNFKPNKGGKGRLSSLLMGIALVAGLASWLVIHQFGQGETMVQNVVDDSAAVLVKAQYLESEAEEDPHAHIRERTNHSNEKTQLLSNNEGENKKITEQTDKASAKGLTSLVQEYEDEQATEENIATEMVEKEALKDSKGNENKKSIDPCKGVLLSANVNATKTCLGASEGSIILTGIKGGKQPYTVSINGGIPQKYAVFDNLRVGSYAITLYDDNACSTKLAQVAVTSKVCDADVNNAFAPELGQTFIVPATANETGVFEVYDVTNTLRASIRFYNELKWDGQDEYGGLLNSGEYTYRITFDNGQINTGSVSIIQ